MSSFVRGYRYLTAEDWTVEGSPYTQSQIWDE